MELTIKTVSTSAILVWAIAQTVNAQAPQASDRAREVASIKAFWTRDRIVSAHPRDLVLDHRGLAYLKGKGGQLAPYGHSLPAVPEPRAKGGNRGGGGGNGGGPPGAGGDSSGDTGSGLENVKNAPWTNGGRVQTAAGRLFFVMDGSGYVCSGTLVNDGETSSDRSIVLTAAHCIYDDVNKAFAESAIFIPNQAGTSGSGTDSDCSNDPEGCWVVDFGVVSVNWTSSVFPNNIPYDYGFVSMGVDNQHPVFWSYESRSVALDTVINPMEISFDPVTFGDYTRALGYSYSDDPNFMYCGEPVAASSYDGYLLPNCGMSGGASGGPWSQSQAPDLAEGPITSVNSYGPSRGRKYMGGPRLDNTDAQCVFNATKSAATANTADIVAC